MSPRLGRTAMLDWSDHPDRTRRDIRADVSDRSSEPGTEFGAGGDALTALLAAHADRLTGRVLVAGPHRADLLDLISSTARQLTVLVRGSVDAERLSARYAGPGIEVLCGDLSDLNGQRFDAAVLLSGLEQIASVESEPSTWAARLEQLQSLLTPDAVRFVRVANPISVAALDAIAADRSADRDADWAGDRDSPSSLAAAEALLAPDGQSPTSWSCFGRTDTPELLVPVGAAPPGSGLAALAVSTTPGSGRTDERVAVRRAADAGLLDVLAPGWILAGPGIDQRRPFAGFEVPDLPAGQLYEEVFLDHCSRRDLAAVRSLLASAEVLLGQEPQARPDSVLVGTDGECSLLPRPAAPGDVDDPLLDFTRRLADRARALAVRDPWPAATDRAEMISLMLAATGRDTPAEEVAALIPDEDPWPATPAHLARIEGQTAAVRAREAALRSEAARMEAWAARLFDTNAEKTEALATARQRIAATRDELAAVRSSRAYRLGRALTKPVRALRR